VPTLNVTKTYEDGTILFQSDLDNIVDDITSFLNTTKIDNSNIQDGGIDGSLKLTTASVVESKIASAAVTTTKIADSNVTTAKIADSNVTTAKIADANVTTVKIADSNVTTAKIADSGITTAKLAFESVTNAKRSAPNIFVSSTCGLFTTTSATDVLVTNLSNTFATTGKPLVIQLMSGIAAPDPILGGSYILNSGGFATVTIARNSTAVASFTIGSQATPPGCILFTETLAAGSYTYEIYVKTGGAGTATINEAKLFIQEL
jgi:hypothetical protein